MSHTPPPFAVLFVDDEERARKYFQMAFESDFPVLTAASVAEAKALLAARCEEIGVLLTDQRMPGAPGVDLLQWARERYPLIGRMITTAYADLDEATAAVNRGEIARYITKPWETERLRGELAGALDAFQVARERSLLLEAKLNVLNRMRQAERLRGLIAIAATLERLHGAPQAVAAWALDSASGAWDGSPAPLELWGADTQATLRLMALGRRLRELDRMTLPLYPDRIALPTLLADAGFEVSGEAADVLCQGSLLERLVRDLSHILGRPAQAQLSTDRLANGAPAVLLRAAGPGAAVNQSEWLFDPYLIAGHHGGALRVTRTPQGMQVRLTLARDPHAAPQVALTDDWLTEQFARLEDWGD